MSSDNLKYDVNNNVENKKPSSQQPRLAHDALHQIPQQVRFVATGFLGNILFMLIYNTAVIQLEHRYEASTIYAVVYFFYIPMGHFMTCWTVFGWPINYIKNLLSNYPIGLSAMALGTVCTYYLDQIGFNERVEDFIRSNLGFASEVATDKDEKGEFYSSLLVLAITSVWSYVLAVLVNTPKQEDEDKEKKEL